MTIDTQETEHRYEAAPSVIMPPPDSLTKRSDSPEARKPAGDVLPGAVRHAHRRVKRRMRRFGLLHEARHAWKRVKRWPSARSPAGSARR